MAQLHNSRDRLHDLYDARVGASTASAAVTHRFNKELTGFSLPSSLTVGAGGDLYVGDAGARVLDRLSSSGTAADFTCAAACSAYVSEAGKGDQITGTPTGAGGSLVAFSNVNGVAVDNATGEIYVSAGSAVDVFAASGKYLSQLTGTCENGGESPPSCTGFTPFGATSGLFFDQTTDELYVGDRFSGVVDVFSPAGEFVSRFGAGFLQHHRRCSVGGGR